MSLVGYAYSDDEDDEQSLSDNEASKINNTGSGSMAQTEINKNTVVSNLSDPKITNGSSDSSRVSNSTVSKLSQLPPVQSATSTLSKDIKRTLNGRIQIAAPSLQLLNQADSDEDSEEEEERRRKRLKRSNEGSRLISMLPKPKNFASIPKPGTSSTVPSSTSSLTSLIPNSVSNRSKAKLPQLSTSNSTKPSTSNISDDRPSGSSSFFFTNQEDDDDDDDDIKIPFEEQLKNDVSSFASFSSTLPPPIADVAYAPEYGPAKPTADEVSNAILNDSLYSPIDSVQLDPNQDVTYKKFIASKFGDESASDIKFMDFDMSQHLKQNTDWIKNITLEKEDKDDEEVGGNVPNSAARRRNQITFLAFQAKKRETELKNQWAQNRVSKNQTRAKYGF